MLVLRGIPARATPPSVLTIGNFDGVHRGHQELLSRLTKRARGVSVDAVVMTFEPHPREFFAPGAAPARLTSLREKLCLLGEHGVDRVHVCRFDARFASLGAGEFIERLLVGGLALRHLIVGDDFRFGRGRTGNFAMLKDAGQIHGFGVEAMETVDIGGERVSSSAVRDALQELDLRHAARLLGRPYAIAGRVVHGDKRGRSIGYPTANVQLKRNLPPFAGVFAVEVGGIARVPRRGVANIGYRPTVDNAPRATLEVHLFDFDGDLYCAHLSVNFLHKLREQRRFESLAALTEQIDRDARQAREFFATRDASDRAEALVDSATGSRAVRGSH